MLLSYTGKRSKDLSLCLGSRSANMLAIHPFCRSTSRLSYKVDIFNYKLASEYVPDLIKDTRGSLTWEECCAKRANDLLKLNREKYYLSYSGGIDSTTALVALLKNWSAKDLERVVVYLSHESIRENPSFFKKYVVKFKLQSSFQGISEDLLRENSLMVTGELGDQLFGSDILGEGSEIFGDLSLFQDYKEWAPQYIASILGPARRDLAPGIFERLHPIVTEAPFPIRTTHDFFWWYNFTQKWQYVKFRFTEKGQWNLAARYQSHIVHFFDDVEFQKWSLCNHDLKLVKSWKNYKHAAKQYLYDFTSDVSQLNLLKVQSLKNNYAFTRKRVAVDANYNEIGYQGLRDYVRG